MNLLEASFDDCEHSQFDLRSDENDDINVFDNMDLQQDHEDATHFPIKKLSEVFDTCAKAEGNMKVYLRVRPTVSRAAGDSTITVESDTTIITNAPDSSKRAQYTKTEERHYVRLRKPHISVTAHLSLTKIPPPSLNPQAFTRVFGPDSQQHDVFTHVAEPLLERFIAGDSCVLFAYGMTNAGKTFTIQGNDATPGIMPQLVNSILQRMAGHSDWDLQASMLEIYQEKVYDLLGAKRDKLAIRDGNGRVEVVKLSSHPIGSAAEAIRLMDTAASKRSKANTTLNSGSSRSHAVYTITLNRIISGRDTISIFQVVDLAGAERGSRTKASNAQQKEANNINMSLMQLWRCLQGMKKKVGLRRPNRDIITFPSKSAIPLPTTHTLSLPQNSEGSSATASDIIPFRESKLTHLLMPLLGRVGLAGMAMITCVNPQIDDYDETLSILSNASLACKIKEITDLGRTTVGVVGMQAQATGKGAVVYNGHGHRTSSLSHASHGSSKVASTSSHAPHASAMKRSSSIKTSLSSLGEDADGNGHTQGAEPADERVMQELQRLRSEVRNLKEANKTLLMSSIEKETEIRIEVATEMATRSMHLLEQIQDLQEQLDARAEHYSDVTKSCKKARRKQVEAQNAEAQGELKEAEEELERVKAQYEQDLSTLRAEKQLLQGEVELWKGQAEEAQRMLTEYKAAAVAAAAAAAASLALPEAPVRASRQSRSGSVTLVPITEEGGMAVTVASSEVSKTAVVVQEGAKEEESRKSAADEFKQRIARDQRFKKDEVNKPHHLSPKKTEVSVRSPLQNIGNSPAKTDAMTGKRALSPKGRAASPVRKHQAVSSHNAAPQMKSHGTFGLGHAGAENAAPAPAPAKRPLRSTFRA